MVHVTCDRDVYRSWDIEARMEIAETLLDQFESFVKKLISEGHPDAPVFRGILADAQQELDQSRAGRYVLRPSSDH